LGDNCSK